MSLQPIIRATSWIALCVLLSLAPLRPVAFAQGRGGPDLTEEQSGTLLLKSSEDADPIEALRVATSIRAEVTGNVARVYVTQQFTNPSSDWVEGLYVFPLAAGSAVDELSMHIGDREVHGEIKEKQAARQVYEQARSAGQRASLTDQERPNMFSTQVANIAPGSSSCRLPSSTVSRDCRNSGRASASVSCRA